MDDPHARGPQEDPRDHIGEVILDPWDDSAQTDWPNHAMELDAAGEVT